MRKIIDYNIVDADGTSILVAKVKRRIKEGWELYGEPYRSSRSSTHYQAMVKYEKEEKKEIL